VELKPSYYRQAVKNIAAALDAQEGDQIGLFSSETDDPLDIEEVAS